jgi:UDP-MurNAc hydroxylase
MLLSKYSLFAPKTQVQIYADTLPCGPIRMRLYFLSDGEATVWDQVDSVVSRVIMRAFNKDYGTIGLALVQWHPLQDMLPMHGGDIVFPYQKYTETLNDIHELKAKKIALGACGFAYSEGYSWINNIAFP